jgi:serine/threonine-protein kinase
LRFVAWSIKWTVATAFFLLIMAASGYFVFLQVNKGGRYVSVPQVTDLPVTQAALLIANAGLELGEQENIPHSVVPKFHVIAQRPAAGRIVRTGRKVYLTVSMGEDYLQVPDLRKRLRSDAEKLLRNAGFELGTVARVQSELRWDTVLAQDPPPGQSAAAGAQVHLLLSAGTEKGSMLMPDLRNKHVTDMVRIMAPYNVILVPNIVDYSEAPVDVVLNQNPPPDTWIQAGQIVTYDVKPSGSLRLPDTRDHTEVRHTLNRDVWSYEIQITLVDKFGVRQEISTGLPPDTRIPAGSTLRIPVAFVGSATVELYVQGELEAQYPVQRQEPST